jgi:ParB-like chromosome segregation protein Spo0J
MENEITNRIKLEVVPISRIRSKPWNPKVREDYTVEVERVRSSISKNGVLYPVIVRTGEDIPQDGQGDLEIVDGETRFLIYKEAGVQEVIVNNLGSMTEAEAKAITFNIEAHVPLDYVRTSLLFKDIVDKEGMERALSLLSVTEDELTTRLGGLEMPAYSDLEMITEDEEAKKALKGHRYFLKIEASLLDKIVKQNGEGKYLIPFDMMWSVVTDDGTP